MKVCDLAAEKGSRAVHLEDGLLDDLRVDVGHTIDSLAANHSQVGHVHQPTSQQVGKSH